MIIRNGRVIDPANGRDEIHVADVIGLLPVCAPQPRVVLARVRCQRYGFFACVHGFVPLLFAEIDAGKQVPGLGISLVVADSLLQGSDSIIGAAHGQQPLGISHIARQGTRSIIGPEHRGNRENHDLTKT